MATYTENVLQLKTAKAILSRCYKADSSASMSKNGFTCHGSSITARIAKVDNGYTVTITSDVFEVSTLKSLITDVFNEIDANRPNQW